MELFTSVLLGKTLQTDLRLILGLGQYGQQPIRYVFDTDLANTIRIYDMIHMCMTLGFKIKNFGFQKQSELFGLIYTVNLTCTKAK